MKALLGDTTCRPELQSTRDPKAERVSETAVYNRDKRDQVLQARPHPRCLRCKAKIQQAQLYISHEQQDEQQS